MENFQPLTPTSSTILPAEAALKNSDFESSSPIDCTETVESNTSKAEADTAVHNSAQAAAVLDQAKETHRLVIEWVRSFDFKIGPILTADSILFASSLAILTQQTSLELLAARPLTHFLLTLTPIALLQSLVMCISAISPSLKWKPWEWGKSRHLPDNSAAKPTSVVFFGQITCFPTENAYAEAAKDVFASEHALLEDILHQTYINANIAVDKSHHITLSTRGLFTAVSILFLAGVFFLLKI